MSLTTPMADRYLFFQAICLLRKSQSCVSTGLHVDLNLHFFKRECREIVRLFYLV
jgi:hypothetical protein